MAPANPRRFRVRFKSFIEQYELRELHFHSLMRTKEIELQYHLARFDRDKKAAEAELTRMRQLETQVQTLSRSETQLRSELGLYIEKLSEACNVGPPSFPTLFYIVGANHYCR